jgi:uncharacterized membrane protein
MRSGDLDQRVTLLGGAGLGAALMYFLEPGAGRRRRGRARRGVTRGARSLARAADVGAHDLGNRARGVAASARARLRHDAAPDDIVMARVRAALGRVVSHPHAVQTDVEDGRVVLRGAVLSEELAPLLATVRRVRGVRGVDDRLAAFADVEGRPALQGGRRRRGPRAAAPAGDHWPPGTRLAAALAGGTLVLLGARRRDAVGAAVGLAGAALVARGAANAGARRLTGVGAGRRAVRVDRCVVIDAPPAQVYKFFSRWEQWPTVMRHVRDVRSTALSGDPDRTRWTVDGPAGVPVTWDAVTTRRVPGETIAWRSVEGSAVRHEGTLRFAALPRGGTRVDVHLAYTPPAGALGHVVAAMLGRDPGRQMAEDLARVKAALEKRRA